MRRRVLVYFAPLLLGAGTISSQTPAPLDPTPQQTITAFYSWYLDAISHDKEPLEQSYGQIASYVSGALIARLERSIRNGSMEEDYFLKAQDFLPDWQQSINVSRATGGGVDIRVFRVTLGKGPGSLHRLSVSVRKERQRWKLVAVTRLK